VPNAKYFIRFSCFTLFFSIISSLFLVLVRFV
jgi:hypothetical protein